MRTPGFGKICAFGQVTFALVALAATVASGNEAETKDVAETEDRANPSGQKEAAYDEQGIKARRSQLESKGMELYRSPAGHYTFNVGVHSLFVYSVTQCLPIQSDLEFRLAVKQWLPMARPDGQETLSVATGQPRTAGTLSLYYAF